MSKRAAEVQLTSDRVEGTDEDEDPGKFEVASEEQLAKRVFKKARRGRTLDDTAGGGGGIFASIKLSNGSSAIPSFKNSAQTSAPLQMTSVPTLAMSSPLQMTSAPFVTTSASIFTSSPPVVAMAAQASSTVIPSVGSSAYLQQLRELNQSVTEWISKHVRENAFVDLTPIFKDYETHLKNIDLKYRPAEGVSPAPPSPTDGSATPPVDTDDKSHDNSEPEDNESQSSVADSHTSVTDSASVADSQVSEGGSQDTTDSIHTVRAKLFYKKGEVFTELGVGMLRVQATSPAGIRLLMRNDTKLGKVLLNVRVSGDIPVSSKTNNVLVVCVANPPLGKDVDSDVPVTYLIRVKTATSADELVKVIKENTQ